MQWTSDTQNGVKGVKGADCYNSHCNTVTEDICIPDHCLQNNQSLGFALVSLWSNLRNRPFDIFSVEWHIICSSADLPICRTTNMDLVIM